MLRSMFSKTALLALSLLGVLLIGSPALAEVRIIVNNSVTDSASKSDIERLFLGKSKTLGASKLSPINQNEGSATRAEFNDKVLGKSDAQLKSYWSRLIFTGKAQPPKEVGGDADVLDLVKSDSSVIGYVSADASVEGVKVIATF